MQRFSKLGRGIIATVLPGKHGLGCFIKAVGVVDYGQWINVACTTVLQHSGQQLAPTVHDWRCKLSVSDTPSSAAILL